MHARDAEKHEEVWLLDRLDEYGFEDPAFRSRDYVLAIEDDSRERAGFARLRAHDADGPVCEFTNIGVLEEYRGQGVGARLLEYLMGRPASRGSRGVRALRGGRLPLAVRLRARCRRGTARPLPERLDAVRDYRPDADPFYLGFEAFEIPLRLRRRFSDEEGTDDPETPEDFGIDPDSATYKYDTSSK